MLVNWYRIFKSAAFNIKFTEEINPQIEQIVNQLLQYLYNLQEIPAQPIFMGQINYINPYNKQEIHNNIYLNNKIMEDENNTVAMIDRQTGNVYINIYKTFIPPKIKPADYLYVKEILKNHLIHEIIHSADPKISNLNKIYDLPEYSKPTEFDAYSKEITSYMLNYYKNLNDKQKETIETWIKNNNFGERTGDIKDLLYMPDDLFNIMKYWKVNNPDYIRKLRQRLYTEVINANN